MPSVKKSNSENGSDNLADTETGDKAAVNTDVKAVETEAVKAADKAAETGSTATVTSAEPENSVVEEKKKRRPYRRRQKSSSGNIARKSYSVKKRSASAADSADTENN
jgi:hypothetical protein